MTYVRICPGCNWGMRWTRRSAAQREAARMSKKPAVRCSLRFTTLAIYLRSFTRLSACNHRNNGNSISRRFEMTVKEITCRAIGGQPRFVQQKIVDFIGKNKLFECDALFAEGFGEVHHFREGHVAVIIALNEKDRRTPSADGRERRRLPSETGRIGALIGLV